MKKLVAVLACRNSGSRLYGKPLQNLDVDKNITILDNIIATLKSINIIDSICLAISNGNENLLYKDIAIKNNLDYIFGDEIDVLGRLIDAGIYTNATDIFRMTSECPFLYFDDLNICWDLYRQNNLDFITQDNLIDGIGWSISSVNALKLSHLNGDIRHRSELCNLYIRENMSDFKTKIYDSPQELIRKDLRLTVDYPEDLILCREIYLTFKNFAPKFPIVKIIKYLDTNPRLKKLVDPFLEKGYSTMY